ncbi:MAG: EamA/RhaT family transporter, partial [Alistipes sp.]|nr:EamA/RhaT family transporter [Alistipes sp.]
LYRGAEKLTSVHMALYRYIQPVVAASLALLRHQEKIDRANIVAATFIFVGIIFVAFSSKGESLPPKKYNPS